MTIIGDRDLPTRPISPSKAEDTTSISLQTISPLLEGFSAVPRAASDYECEWLGEFHGKLYYKPGQISATSCGAKVLLLQVTFNAREKFKRWAIWSTPGKGEDTNI